MSKLLIFNWKMNPGTIHEAFSLTKSSDYKNVVVAPPFSFLETVGRTLKKAKLGAQDLFWESRGAFTGEVSAEQLKSLCVQYVIIGHSERRHKLGETDEMVAKKLKAALNAGLMPILCVGETAREHAAGKTKEILKKQVNKALYKIPKRSTLTANRLIVAYEPVWAIGTGNPETPASAKETIKYIKTLLNANRYTLNAKMLYGGSVDSKNLGAYLRYKEIDGALVGGASLKKEEIKRMIQIY